MKKRHFTCSIVLLLALQISAQNIYVPLNARINISEGAFITAGGDVENEGIIKTNDKSEFIALGDMNNTNDGRFYNEGTLSLFGNWMNTGTYNSLKGTMAFKGGKNQLISNTNLTIKNLTVNKTGVVTLLGNYILVTDKLSFENGILTKGANTEVIIGPTARVDYFLGSMSYFEGEIIAQGTLDRRFPVGNDGFYGTIGLINVRGTDATEFALSMSHQNSEAAIPDAELIGVSDDNIWKVDFRKGFVDSLQIEIDFISEDLENFTNENVIRRRFDSPVIVVADSTPLGPYRSIGIAELINTDSVTYGTAISQPYDQFQNYGSKYFAVGLAPRIDPAGQIYFPNVFAPAASDAINRSYRVFGELIANEPFKLQIYNKFSLLVYEAKSFEEASTIGWDGRNKQGNEEYTGIFYVHVSYAYKHSLDQMKKFSGTILLKR